jgi:type II restriction enzyme
VSRRTASKTEAGEILADKWRDEIRKLREEYVRQRGQQPWNSYIGHRFEGLIHSILKGYAKNLSSKVAEFHGIRVLTAGEVKRDEIITRKLAVKYGDFFLLPDVDSVIVWIDSKNRRNSEILAVISCKTSLRERIAQACYWKLKLISSDLQKRIRVFLATADNDNDFNLKDDAERFDELLSALRSYVRQSGINTAVAV